MITQEDLKKKLSYDPETGIFIWIGSTRKGFNEKAIELFGTYACINEIVKL